MTTFGVNAFGVGTGPQRFASMVAFAREAEEAGCAAVWTSELYSRSATVPMAAIAAGTSTIAIGSNIAYGVGRSPLMWAAEARDLDELSGGRVILGLGNGTPKMMEAWHGVSGDAPAARMAELVTVLRKLWHLHEGPVHHDGRFYNLHVVPTSDVAEPVRPEIPIWIAGREQADAAHGGAVCGRSGGASDVHRGVRPRTGCGGNRCGRAACRP